MAPLGGQNEKDEDDANGSMAVSEGTKEVEAEIAEPAKDVTPAEKDKV